jgi:fucose permease
MTSRWRSLAAYLRGHQRWCVVALLFVVAAVNNLDRQALSVLAATLKTELHFGNVEYSYISSAFLAAYALGYAFCGRHPKKPR